MHLLGFSVSFAFLTLACIFGIAAIATNVWWKDEDGNFKAGIWQQCYADTPCVNYGTVFDRSLKKLLNASFDETREKLKDEEYHLNVVRIIAVFDLICLGVATFIIGLFIFSIKTQISKSIAICLQAAVATIILIAGILGLASAIHATNYKKIFGFQLEGMKLGGSWMVFLLCNIIALLVGCVIVTTLCYHSCIKPKRTKTECEKTKTKPSSRKSSKDVAKEFSVHQHPDAKCEDVEHAVDESENEYKIPEQISEVISNYEGLHDEQSRDGLRDEHSMDGSRENQSYNESDYTLGQLSDYSSQPMSELNDDFHLANNRSASFSNQLYDDVN